MTGCSTCDLGLEHCHAPIVEHRDGTYECLDGCGGPRAIHDDVLVAAVFDDNGDDRDERTVLAPAA